MSEINIVKASGDLVPFNPGKLARSLERAGAGKPVINTILQEVEDTLYDGIKSRKIYQLAYKLLNQYGAAVAGKYKLKAAIFELGPTGYPFERFVGALFQNQGYAVKVGVNIQGKCVSHEVDVVARKNHLTLLMECKFHKDPGRKSNVQVPLYIQSRFQDVVSMLSKESDHMKYECWVVTNTQFTEDARDYGKCMNMRMLSWDYPEDGNLKDRIDRSGLHPITSMRSLKKFEKQLLLDADVVLCKEVSQNPELLEKVGISKNKMTRVLQEAEDIVGLT